MQLFKRTCFHWNKIEAAKCCIDRGLVDLLLLAENSEDVVVGRNHARYALSHILRVQVLEVDLHVRLEIKELLILIGGERGGVELFKRE